MGHTQGKPAPVKFSIQPLVCICLLGLPFASPAHDIITTKLTYSRDISRIFAKRCTGCHAASSSIPLHSYETVRPWAVDIKEQVLSRQMPPWGAVKGFGNLSHDAGLTEEEILIIAAWVVGGAPQGNPALLPAAKPVTLPPAQANRPLHDVCQVSKQIKITQSLELAGIRPQNSGPVISAKIIVALPDGSTMPLLWLFHYDPKWKQVFQFRSPIPLPVGSVIQSDIPLQYTLLRK